MLYHLGANKLPKVFFLRFFLYMLKGEEFLKINNTCKYIRILDLSLHILGVICSEYGARVLLLNLYYNCLI